MDKPVILLILGVLSCYRLAILVSEDDGPANIFGRLRQWTDKKRQIEQQKAMNIILADSNLTPDQRLSKYMDNRHLLHGKWSNIDEGIRCPYCVGVWAAFLLAILVYTGIGDFILLFLGIAGGQALLQDLRKDE